MHPAHDRRDVLGTRRRNAHKLDGVSGCVQRKHPVGGRGGKVGVQPQVRPEALCDGHAAPERSLDAKSTRLLQGPSPHLVDVRASKIPLRHRTSHDSRVLDGRARHGSGRLPVRCPEAPLLEGPTEILRRLTTEHPTPSPDSRLRVASRSKASQPKTAREPRSRETDSWGCEPAQTAMTPDRCPGVTGPESRARTFVISEPHRGAPFRSPVPAYGTAGRAARPTAGVSGPSA